MKLLRSLLLGALAGCQLPTSEGPGQPCASSHPASEDAEDDRDVQRRIEEAATRLIEGKRTRPAKELRGQLDRTSCRLERPPVPPAPLPLSELYELRRPGVVAVCGIYSCGRCSRWHSSIASGFVVTADGVIATNHHVMANDDRETFVVYVDGQGVFPVREVAAASRRNDLALLRIELPERTRLRPIPIAPSGPVGTAVSVISHPDQRFFTLTQGIVSRHFSSRRHGEIAPAMAITADYAKGSSGAPVMDPAGAVVGVVSSTNSIYYEVKDGVQKNLQMVVKQCVPSSCLLELISRD